MSTTKESWHVGKEIPITVIIAILAQTGALIWYLAAFTSTVSANQKRLDEKLDDLSNQVASLSADKYTQHDAARDMALVNEKIENLRREIYRRR